MIPVLVARWRRAQIEAGKDPDLHTSDRITKLLGGAMAPVEPGDHAILQGPWRRFLPLSQETKEALEPLRRRRGAGFRRYDIWDAVSLEQIPERCRLFVGSHVPEISVIRSWWATTSVGDLANEAFQRMLSFATATWFLGDTPANNSQVGDLLFSGPIPMSDIVVPEMQSICVQLQFTNTEEWTEVARKFREKNPIAPKLMLWIHLEQWR